MRIELEYDEYFVYSAVYHNGKQSSCGACPVVWEDQSALPGTQNKRLLTFADGNYHLYDDEWFMEDDTDVVEGTIISALNEAGATFGRIKLNNTDCEVCWCLLEKEQAIIVMDIPNWTVSN